MRRRLFNHSPVGAVGGSRSIRGGAGCLLVCDNSSTNFPEMDRAYFAKL